MTVADRGRRYAIREPRNVEEFAQLAGVLASVFSLPDRASPPAWLMKDTTAAGGVTLGLWQDDDPVGACYAFPGIADGEPYLYSDALGILPGHRSAGLARALKLRQREHALERGLRRIVWTFSALRSVNAYLYVTRLGAIGTKYLPDHRGTLDGEWGLERGVPFDEFFVDWRLDSYRARTRVNAAAPAPVVGSATVLSRCHGRPPEVILDELSDPAALSRVAVEVPPDYQYLVDHHQALARDWHDQTRPLFSQLLDGGHVLTECLREPASGRVQYLFEQHRPA